MVAGDQPLLIKYSRLDMGEIKNIFDGELDTLIRTLVSNPLELQIEFASPRRMKGLQLQIGGEASILDVTADVAGSDQPKEWSVQVGDSPTASSSIAGFWRSAGCAPLGYSPGQYAQQRTGACASLGTYFSITNDIIKRCVIEANPSRTQLWNIKKGRHGSKTRNNF